MVDAKGLKVEFQSSISGSTCNVTAKFSNSNAAVLTDFDFLVAVPKYLKLSMHPLSSNVIPAGSSGQTTQTFSLENSMHGTKKLMIRYRLQYKNGPAVVKEQGQFGDF